MDRDLIREGCKQITAGGTAGLIEVCTLYPLDLVKTRMQLTNTRQMGMIECFVNTGKQEGLRGFYKGILPPILAQTPKTAIRFLTFEQYQKIFQNSEIPGAMVSSLAGLLSGLTEAFLVCPFEFLKVQLQADRSKNGMNTIQLAQKIIKSHGYGTNGLFRGLNSVLARHSIFNMLYFGIYHNLKPLIPAKEENEIMNLTSTIVIGFIAAAIGSSLNIPFDVAKSRIQGPQSEPRKYYGTIQTIQLIYREEGSRALCKGLIPKVVRLAPGGAISIITYEYLISLFG